MDKVRYNKYWQKFSDTIESSIIRKVRRSKLNVSIINQEYSNYCKKWEDKRSVEGLWLNDLYNENPNIATCFISELKSFSFYEVKIESSSIVKYYVVSFIISLIVCLFFVFALKLTSWKLFFSITLCVMIVFGFFIPYGKGKTEKNNKATVEKYMVQLRDLKSRLDLFLLNT